MSHTIKAFGKSCFLVVQDIFLTETAALADVVLPAACFAEKDGTFTNTARMVQRVRKAVEPPGEARADSAIILELAKRLGYEMRYDVIEDVFSESGKMWPALAGITYKRIAKNGLQWPCPTLDHPGTQYLFKGGFPRGKASFTVVNYKPSEELPDSEFPFILSSGRILFQYHTGTMTRRVKAINAVAPTAYVEIHPDDAERLGVSSQEMVTVSSRRSSIDIRSIDLSASEEWSHPFLFQGFCQCAYKYRSRSGIKDTRTQGVCCPDREEEIVMVGEILYI